MIPSDLQIFFIASLGAAASFIGLLFVGLSVVLQRAGTNQKLADTDRLLAESSYAALINIFFISLVAILPHSSIGFVALAMALTGLVNCFRLKKLSQPGPLIISGLIYLYETWFGINIIFHSHRFVDIAELQTIIIALFAISLVRAWGLTGIYKKR